MNPLQRLAEAGQSVWYDNIRRALLDSGELARYRDEYAVTGVTANPTIFEHAIAGSADYDDEIRAHLDEAHDDPQALFWRLAVADVAAAADVLRPVYDRTGGVDGYASLELSPRIAHDTDVSIEAGVDLFSRMDRPNVMVKVPGTREGARVIEELTARGVNVNVTLLFSVAQWEAAAEAYLSGLERRLAGGADLDVASVASFFISRIDRLANEQLPPAARNSLGVASAQMALAAYRRLEAGERWQRLAAAGARPQRLLWASTSTKDPDLADTFYVTALAMPGTVDTMPDATLKAFADHGEVGDVMDPHARVHVDAVELATGAGLDLDDLAAELQRRGIEQFADSFDRVLACVEAKAAMLRLDRRSRDRIEPIQSEVAGILDDLVEAEAVARLWKRDHTLWQDDPSEVADRLGWLDLPAEMLERVEGLEAFAERASADGLTDAVVCGMGGSSLFPLVLADVFGGRRLRVHVLDTVDPAAVQRVTAELPLDATLVVASSKSGTTVETRSLLAWFAERVDADRLVAITDPGTPLDAHGREHDFRAVFTNPSDIGGRYSALSSYGLAPGALAGAGLTELLHRAGRMVAACADCVATTANPAAQLAAALAGGVRAGRDKLTVVLPGRYAAFGLWIEQLVAESTGKRGTGLLPVVGEPLADPGVYGDDRLFVVYGDHDGVDALADAGHPVLRFDLDDEADVGAEVMRWELAVALAGAALGINPFDQPDVEAAKSAARDALGGAPAVEPVALASLLEQLRPGDYLALLAYCDPASEQAAHLADVRVALRDRHRIAVTLGFGPRYLHSTGQLHKGGPDTGVFVQVVADHGDDPPVPGAGYGLAGLERAQAAGDLQALHAAGRRAGRVAFDELLGVTT